ncbi:MAG TPA: hypothetical protein DCZ56_04230 [Sutterella sp.]|nr:hypothetical protein [Sutterella sp.]
MPARLQQTGSDSVRIRPVARTIFFDFRRFKEFVSFDLRYFPIEISFDFRIKRACKVFDFRFFSMKRKIYSQLLRWKQEVRGRAAR